jgi:hypothetical protein
MRATRLLGRKTIANKLATVPPNRNRNTSSLIDPATAVAAKLAARPLTTSPLENEFAFAINSPLEIGIRSIHLNILLRNVRQGLF